VELQAHTAPLKTTIFQIL